MSSVSRLFSVSLLAGTALAGLSGAAAQTAPSLAAALPVDGTVVQGQAVIGAPSGAGMAIRQDSQRAIIDWQAFSVGEGFHLDILQPSATAALLNRVTGNTASTIAGQINANGQVVLVNPNGIAITRSGTINAGSFVASTLDLADDDFMAGRLNFTGNGASAGVRNAGRIGVVSGGLAALLGGTVANDGVIVARAGRVALGSGEAMTLDLTGDGFLSVAVPTSTTAGDSALITQSGRIDGATVVIAAATAIDAARKAVNMSGVVEARAMAGGDGGSIILSGGAGGAIAISGSLDASGKAAGARGGDVTVTGQDIALAGAGIDVSGDAGGGMVRIGGDREGKGPLLRADTLAMDADSRITADALTAGNGGDIVLWSDKLTRFAGSILARGGSAGGNGGEVEVSSAGVLGYEGLADLRAANGDTGNLLLDPYNIIISNGTQTTGSGFAPSANDSIINATTLSNALAAANVSVATGRAGSAGSQLGTISVTAPLSWTSTNTLTLDAFNAITTTAAITAPNGGLTLITSRGGATITAGAIAVQSLGVTTAGGAVSLVNAANSIARFSASAGFADVSLTNNRDLILGPIQNVNTLLINNGTGNVTQSAATVAGNVAINTPGTIELLNPGNNIARFSAMVAGSVRSITTTGNLEIGNVLAPLGTLTLNTSAGVVRQVAGTLLEVNRIVSRSSGGLSIGAGATARVAALDAVGGDVIIANSRSLVIEQLDLGAGTALVSMLGAGSSLSQRVATSGNLIRAGYFSVLTEGGSADLTGGSNRISTIDVRTQGGNFLLANTDLLAIDRLNTNAGSVTINNGVAGIVQSDSSSANRGIIAANLALTIGNANASFNNPFNQIGQFSLNGAGASVSLLNSRSLEIAASNVGTGSIFIENSANPITQRGAVTAGLLRVSGSAITLTNTGNALAAIAAAARAGDISLVNAGALTINGATASGAISITNRSGAILQSSAISANALSVTTSNAAVTLQDSQNAFGTFSAATGGGSVSLTNSRALTLAASNLGGGSLAISTLGPGSTIGQTGALTAFGVSLTTNNGAVAFTSTGNAIRSFGATTGGGNVTLANTAQLTLSASNLGAGTMIVNNGGRSVSQSGSPITAGSLSVTTSGAAVALTLANQLDNFAVTTGGISATITNGKALNLGTINVGAGNFTVSVGANNVTQSGDLTASALTITTSTGNVTLDRPGNSFAGLAAFSTSGNFRLANSRALELRNIQLNAGSLEINNGAGNLNTVTQLSSASANLLSITTAGAAVTLGSTSNSLANFSANTAGGNVILGNNRSLSIGTSNLGAGTLTLTNGISSTHTVSQSGAITAASMAVTTVGAAINLSTQANQVVALVVNTAGGSASLVNGRALSLGTSNLGTGTLTINNGTAAITQSGALTAGTLNVTNTTGDITLLQANQISTFDGSSNGNVTLMNNRALSVGLSSVQSLSINNGANAVTQSAGSSLSTGLVAVTTTGAPVTFTASGNFIGGFSANTAGGDASIRTRAPLRLDTSNLGAGTLTIVSTGTPIGDISQAGAITAAAVSVTTAGPGVVLTNNANQIGAFSATTLGGNISLTNTGALSLGTINLGTGELSLAGGSSITQTGAITAGQLSIANSVGNVTLNAANSISSLAGRYTNQLRLSNTRELTLSNFGARARLDLNNGGNAVRQIGALGILDLRIVTAGASVILEDAANKIDMLSVFTAGGSLSLVNSTEIRLISVDLGAGNFALTNNGTDSAIGQSGRITASSLAVTTNSAAAVTLNTSNNIGAFSATTLGGSVRLANSRALALGTSNLGAGTLTINNGSFNITQSGALTAAALAVTSTAAAGPLLTNTGNLLDAFSVNTAGGSASLVNGRALSLGTSNLGTGTLTINNGTAAITQSGVIDTRELSLTTSGGINLSTQANQVRIVAINTAGGSASLANGRALEIATSNLGAGTLTINNGANAVTQSGAITAGGVAITTNQSAITLDSNGNSIGTLSAAAGSGNIVVSNTPALIVQAVSGGRIAIASTGNLTLGSAASITGSAAGDAVVLQTGGNFISAGTGTIATPNGRFLVFAADPSRLAVSSGLSARTFYGVTPAAYSGGTGIGAAGNRFVFASTPSATITPQDASFAYDGTARRLTSFALVRRGSLDTATGGSRFDDLAEIMTGTPETASVGTVNRAGGLAGGVVLPWQLGIGNLASLASPIGYALASGTGNLTITPRLLDVTGLAAANRRYDGTTLVALTGGTLDPSAIVAADAGRVALTLASTGSVASANAGTGKAVSFAAGGLSGASAGNYSLNPIGALAVDITPATLVITAADDAKVYDGGTASSATPTFLLDGRAATGLFINQSNVAGGVAQRDSFAALTQAFNAPTVAGASQTRVAAVTIADGNNGGNYVVTTRSGIGAISPATLTYVANAASRIYGDANPALAGTVTGFVNNEGIGSATTGSLVFTSAAGTGTGVGSHAIVGGGLGAANYGFQQAVGNGTALTITQRPLSVLYTADASSSIYGNTPSGLTGTVTSAGLVNGDTLIGTAGFATPANALSNVGSHAITGSGLSASGNYLLTANQAAGNDTALTITQRTLTVTADGKTRVYGDANPGLTFALGGMGLVNGDRLAGALTTAADATSNVGLYAITRGSLAASSNYLLTFAGADLSVTPRPLSIVYTANAASTVYGNPPAGLGGTVASDGLVNGDAIIGTASFTTLANALSNVGSHAITGAGVSASSNYLLSASQAAGNQTALTITQRPLTVTADGKTRVYGDANPGLTFAVGGMGLVNGDTLTGALATEATLISGVGSYAITQGSLAATSNYSLTYVGGQLVITPATLTIGGPRPQKTYGSADPTIGFTVSGLKNGELAAQLFTGALARAAGNDVGFYPVLQGSLSAGANYRIVVGLPDFRIVPAVLRVTAPTLSRLQGIANPLLVPTITGFRAAAAGLPVDTIAVLNSVPVVATSASIRSAPGSYATIASGGAALNYVFTYVPGMLTVIASPTLNLSAPATLSIWDEVSMLDAGSGAR